ncbi:MAG: undecaprenyl-diphosphate phosphatase, partial [Pseudomonadota bacterium]
METWQVVLLGLLEGLTEFIPVSSTGHLLLAGHFLGFNSPGKTFEILIQLGAILAILSVYAGRLWQMAMSLPTSAETRRFVFGILLAFMPAAIIGVLAHDFIKTVLFESPQLICITLLIGGFILLAVDRMTLTPRYTDVTEFPPSLALKIGMVQCLAMVPGVSRSGATIVGSLLMGTDKRSAAEFS